MKKALKFQWLALMLAPMLTISLAGCDLDVEDPGEMPEVDIEGGEAPEIDADPLDVDVDIDEVEDDGTEKDVIGNEDIE